MAWLALGLGTSEDYTLFDDEVLEIAAELT
jgi:hypothetical protein